MYIFPDAWAFSFIPDSEMNELSTYQKLRKSDKNAMDMLDVDTLDYLLKKGAFESYINMYDTLCNMCKDGMIMHDDYMQCLIHPYTKWGSRAGQILFEMRKGMWDKIRERKLGKQ